MSHSFTLKMHILFTITGIYFVCSSLLFTAQGLVLIKVMFRNETNRLDLDRFAEEYHVDVWNKNSNEMVAAVSDDVSQEMQLYFDVEILNPDLNQAIEKSMEANKDASRIMRGRFRPPPITYYASYRDIVIYMQKITRQLPGVAFIRSIGKTYRGRDIKVIRFGTGSESKPAVLVMSGQHGREWLSIGNGVYFINILSMGVLRRRARIMNLLRRFDFYIIPVANPDGYEYSRSGKKNRLWRKTVSKQDYGCIGVDPNRNFDVAYKPHELDCEEDPCFIAFRGQYAFSENCTRNIRNFALNFPMTNRIKLFFDLHSYAQQFYYPYGYNSSIKMRDHDEVVRVAHIALNALQKVNKREFEIGPPGLINYNGSGIAMDWFKDVVGVKYSFTIESYPTLKSSEGFLVKPKEIISSGSETLAAILAAAENIKI